MAFFFLSKSFLRFAGKEGRGQGGQGVRGGQGGQGGQGGARGKGVAVKEGGG